MDYISMIFLRYPLQALLLIRNFKFKLPLYFTIAKFFFLPLPIHIETSSRF